MKSLTVCGLLMLLAIPATSAAKDKQIPYVEIFGGFSYLNADSNGASPSRQSYPGWKAAASTPLNSYFALDYEVSGNYKTIDYTITLDGINSIKTGLHLRNYTIFFGPRVNFGPMFVHAMLGGDYLSGNLVGIKKSQWSFAGALGGGIQIPATRLISFRVSADYEIAKHDVFGNLPQYAGSYVYYPEKLQNNFRASAGIVFKIWHQ